MTFNGTEGGEISIEQAARMTAAYRAENPESALANFFGRDILEKLLNQEGCVGIRMYYGINDEGGKELVLVGVNAEGNDLQELVADLSVPCPKICSEKNPLNS